MTATTLNAQNYYADTQRGSDVLFVNQQLMNTFKNAVTGVKDFANKLWGTKEQPNENAKRILDNQNKVFQAIKDLPDFEKGKGN